MPSADPGVLPPSTADGIDRPVGPLSARSAPWLRTATAVAAVAVILRLGLLPQPPHNDEAGYLLVARAWHLGGSYLYGHYWVDRPPGLLLLYRIAAVAAWPPTIRLLTIPFVTLLVLTAAWAADQVAGPVAARWSAVVAGALAVSPLLGTEVADGELFAAPLVMLAIALTLRAVWARSRPSYGWGVAAGMAAGLAVTVKQNFVDAIVFAVVLVLASMVRGTLSRRHGLLFLLSGAAGGAVVAAATAAYALAAGVGVDALWFDLYAFRLHAVEVLQADRQQGSMTRPVHLLVLMLLSGTLLVLALLAWQIGRRRDYGSPFAWALAVTIAIQCASIAAGGGGWSHYLVQLVPTVALGAGAWSKQLPSLRAAAVLSVTSALLTLANATLTQPHHPSTEQKLGALVARASRPGDTATVLYPRQRLQLATGMDSPYPYLWYLEIRELDPHLAQLQALLRGPHAPTWVIVWGHVTAGPYGPRDPLRHVLSSRYQVVGHLCGNRLVLLRDGVHRTLPAGQICRR